MHSRCSTCVHLLPTPFITILRPPPPHLSSKDQLWPSLSPSSPPPPPPPHHYDHYDHHHRHDHHKMTICMADTAAGSNECIPPPTNPLSKVMSEELLDLCRLYPDPYCRSLRQTLATINGCTPEQVLVDSGADSLISLALRESHLPSLRLTASPLPLSPSTAAVETAHRRRRNSSSIGRHNSFCFSLMGYSPWCYCQARGLAQATLS